MKHAGAIIMKMRDLGFTEFTGKIGITGVVSFAFTSNKKSGMKQRMGIKNVNIYFFDTENGKDKTLSSQITYFGGEIRTSEVSTLRGLLGFLIDNVEVEVQNDEGKGIEGSD